MPECAAVCLDQRAADYQTHADAFLFAGKKRLENISGCFLSKTRAAILDGNQRHIVYFIFLDFDSNVGGAEIGCLNRINSIAQQV